MKNKYLNKEGINRKYSVRDKLITAGETLGIIGGVAEAGFQFIDNFSKYQYFHSKGEVGEYLLGIGIVAGSYVLGNYLSKRNKIKKEKALKSLENVAQ
jgi:hypothetical protein